MQYPKITIVTPNFNGAKYLEATIKSIINQDYPNLEYIIIDGGSTDSSIDIIKRYENYLFYWESEKDKGLYDALNKGFSKSSGEIMGWLNSDDMLHPKSLFTLSAIFSNLEIKWIQGTHTWFDEEGKTFRALPVQIKSKFDYLLKNYKNRFSPFIQQESTYWRRSLYEAAGSHISTEYQLAGDFELWMRFFRKSELFLTQSLIGGFRMTGQNQLSSNYKLYLQEADRIIDNYSLTDREKEVIKRLKKNNFIKKIPLIRKIYSKGKNSIKEEFRFCNWNVSTKQFELF